MLGGLASAESDVVIDVRGVSKRFRRNIRLRKLFVDYVLRRSGDTGDQFVALSDVSLRIRRGEVVGIIGSNGAGKTTLIKMIAGLLRTDEGTISVKGRVCALLALGLGVNPDFTGRENIHYGGLMIGMSAAEITAKTDSIIEFAELGDFIDQPFRTYSSGMRARLVFSIAISVEPDILIVDEALATGDAYFVGKCLRRIREICSSSATVILISHNLQQIEEACERVILLEHGRVVGDGSPRQIIDRYIDALYHGAADKSGGKQARRQGPIGMTSGTGEISIQEIFTTVEGERISVLPILEDSILHVVFESHAELPEVSVCVDIFTEKSAISFAFLTNADVVRGKVNSHVFSVAPGVYELRFSLPMLPFGDGHYHCDVEFFPGAHDYKFSYDTCYCYYKKVWNFQAAYRNKRFFGRGTLCEVPVSSIEVKRITVEA